MVDFILWTIGAIISAIGILCVFCLPPLIIELRRAENEDKQ